MCNGGGAADPTRGGEKRSAATGKREKKGGEEQRRGRREGIGEGATRVQREWRGREMREEDAECYQIMERIFIIAGS